MSQSEMKNELKRNEFVYIYNFQQTLFFIEEGIVPVEIGIGSKGDTYHKFKRNEELDVVFTEWVERVR